MKKMIGATILMLILLAFAHAAETEEDDVCKLVWDPVSDSYRCDGRIYIYPEPGLE